MMSRRSEISNVVTTGVDRISECPDSVLVHVLSFLPTEDAVKTEVLSKRWQFLWTDLPSLDFRSSLSVDDAEDSDDEDAILAAKTGFATFVDKTLSRYLRFSNRSKLKKFGLYFVYELRFASNVNSWTQFAAGEGVEVLYLCPYPWGEYYELPQLLYYNSWFKELEFLWCKVVPKTKVAWNSLTKLKMHGMELTNDVIERILAGSPVLGILELSQCRGFSRLVVTNSSLKKVILRYILCTSDEVDDVLEISAPHLLSLEIDGLVGQFLYLIGRGYRFMNASSLVDAVFNLRRISDGEWANNYERIQNMVGGRGILASLLHVKNLTLGIWVLEALSIMEAKGLSCSFLNCKCLTLNTEINKYVFPGIASMLKRTPNLETLILNLSFSSDEWIGMKVAAVCNYNEENYWISQKWTYKCLTLHLKNVTFTGELFQSHSNNTSFFSFAQFLLKNARVLQKMVIRKPSDNQLKEYCYAAKKLLSYPRSSPDAAVIFC